MAFARGQFPTGTYERCTATGRAHDHPLDGSGFSMMWPREIGTTPFKDGKQDQVKQFDWKEGTLVVPPPPVVPPAFQQRQDAGALREARGWNNDLYPFTTTCVGSRSHRNRLSG